MHCFVVNICMNINCMHEEIRVCSWLLILMVTKCFGQNYSFLFHLQKKDVTAQLLPPCKGGGIKPEKEHIEQQKQYGKAVILYAMKFIDLKVFSVPPVLEWDLTNQSVKL